VRFITDFITSMDKRPDVIAFQEIGGQTNNDYRSIEALQARLGGEYPHRSISQAPDGRRIKVVFLSRLELKLPKDITDFPPGPLGTVVDFGGESLAKMGRGALKVEIKPQAGIGIRLINVHLKSKLLSFLREDGGISFEPRSENERVFGAGIALMRRAAEAVTVEVSLTPRWKPRRGCTRSFSAI
jgi:hypothetical protein